MYLSSPRVRRFQRGTRTPCTVYSQQLTNSNLSIRCLLYSEPDFPCTSFVNLLYTTGSLPDALWFDRPRMLELVAGRRVPDMLAERDTCSSVNSVQTVYRVQCTVYSIVQYSKVQKKYSKVQ